MGTNEEVSLQDDLDIEKGFNDAIDSLRKSLGQSVEDSDEELEKAGMPPQFRANAKKMRARADEEEPEEDEDEEEEEEEESYRKSIEDTLREEPEAAAAMDVEPFLLQLAKAMDEAISSAMSVLEAKVAKVENLSKSIGRATVAVADLEKSNRDMLKAIGGQPVPTGSLRVLRKARFEGDGGSVEVDTREVLSKSRDWVLQKKIDLIEAGNIESRINKGRLGKVGDALDHKVAALMKEVG